MLSNNEGRTPEKTVSYREKDILEMIKAGEITKEGLIRLFEASRGHYEIRSAILNQDFIPVRTKIVVAKDCADRDSLFISIIKSSEVEPDLLMEMGRISNERAVWEEILKKCQVPKAYVLSIKGCDDLILKYFNHDLTLEEICTIGGKNPDLKVWDEIRAAIVRRYSGMNEGGGGEDERE